MTNEHDDRSTKVSVEEGLPSSNKSQSKAGAAGGEGADGGGGGMKPMDVKIGHEHAVMVGKSARGRRVHPSLAPSQRLFVSPKVMKRSINVLRFGIFADSVNSTILQPNFPIMVIPDAHPDSFPDTGPFDFSGATYFIPMTALLGVSLSSIVIGTISDKVGRKICIMVCLWGSVIGSALKYFLAFNFWAFCGANFLNGLVSAAVPVALAYVGDVMESRQEKESEIGILVGMSMLGASGGGICAILLTSQGLFVPLWIGVGIMILASLLCQFLLIEPSKDLHTAVDDAEKGVEEDDDASAPETLNQKHLWNIVIGALGDNIGSSGLFPLCLSPLAFNAYYTDFVDQELPPVMTQDAYKWISVLLAIMVIPGTLVSPWFFGKIGTAGGCVLGNAITGVVTIGLLYIGLVAPPTTAWFGIFCAILYASFPFTVISQLSTGPMLDVISPVDKRGYCQGLNITVMNFAMAVAPFLLGTLADAAGTPVAIWLCVGISFLAALINVPLIFVKGLGPSPQGVGDESKALKWEDKDLVERALRGEWVPAEDLDRLNEDRMRRGLPYLVIHYGSYEDDKVRLYEIRRRAQEDFQGMSRRMDEFIGKYNRGEEDVRELCQKVNASLHLSEDKEDVIYKELGEWFADYLRDSGYFAHTSAPMLKQMMLSAFPVVTRNKELTPENFEEVLLNTQRLYNKFSELEAKDPSKVDLKKVLSTGMGSSLAFRVAL